MPLLACLGDLKPKKCKKIEVVCVAPPMEPIGAATHQTQLSCILQENWGCANHAYLVAARKLTSIWKA